MNKNHFIIPFTLLSAVVYSISDCLQGHRTLSLRMGFGLHLVPLVNDLNNEICALLEYYAASSSNPLPTFRDNVSVPSSRVKTSKKMMMMGPIRCTETSVKDYHSTLHNIPEERRSHQHRSGSLKSRPG